MKIEIDIPDKKINNWAIQTFSVNENEALMSLFTYKDRCVPVGEYKKLTRNGMTIMSNTPSEIRDHLDFIYRATGNVLINGLGLGVCLKAILKKEKIKTVTVIEKHEEVIQLVAPHIKDKKVSIIHADAFEWKPPKNMRYNVIWHDIWNDICTDNLSEMTKLHRKYSKRTDWQDSWSKHLLKRMKHNE